MTVAPIEPVEADAEDDERPAVIAANLRNAGMQPEAITVLNRAIADGSPWRQDPATWHMVYVIECDRNEHQRARDAAAQMVALGVQNAEPWCDYGLAQMACGDWTEARESLEFAWLAADADRYPRLHPVRVTIQQALGGLYYRLGDPRKGLACFRWVSAIDPLTAPGEMRYALSENRLRFRHDRLAWSLHEARFEFVARYVWDKGLMPTAPRWTGSEVGPVTIVKEQGAGDLLMMLRYAPLIADITTEPVTVRCNESLHRFVSRLPGVGRCIASDAPVTTGYWLPAMSAPFVFGCDDWKDIPPPTLARYDAPAVPVPKRLGLCWSGAREHPNDFDRSAPVWSLDAIRPILPGWEFQTLQPGPCPDWVTPLPEGDYDDTATAIRSCSAVVTVDTSVLHLAGSLGVPFAGILPTSPEWRWGVDYKRTPWYPVMHALRRQHVGHWERAWECAALWAGRLP